MRNNICIEKRDSISHKFDLSYDNTAWKVAKHGVFSGLCFPLFGLNTEIYSENLRIKSKYRKIRTRNNSVSEHFSRSKNDNTRKSPEKLRRIRKMVSSKCSVDTSKVAAVLRNNICDFLYNKNEFCNNF